MFAPLLVAALLVAGAGDSADKGFVPKQTRAPLGEKRIALVIGNGAYSKGPLKNPTRDAKAMAETLASVGFDVDAQFDLDRAGMLRALRRFAERLDKDSVALFYYSGHGITQDGRSYMLPVASSIRTAADVELEAVDLRRVTARLEEVGSRLNLVILDACRNNPIAYARKRSGGGGLAFLSAPTGTLIAYATAPGQTAADGRGKLSPYTKALVQELKVPGRPVEEVFKAVRVRVRKASKGGQVPWESSSLEGRFVFVPEGWEPELIAPDENETLAATTDEAPKKAKRKRKKPPKRKVAALKRPKHKPTLEDRLEAKVRDSRPPGTSALLLRHASIDRRQGPASKLLIGSSVGMGGLVIAALGGVLGGAVAYNATVNAPASTQLLGIVFVAGCYTLSILAFSAMLPACFVTGFSALYTLNLYSNRRMVEGKLAEKGVKPPKPQTSMAF